MPRTVAELREEIAAKSKELHEIFEQAGQTFDFARAERLKGLDADGQVKEVRRRNDELTALGKELDGLKELDEIQRRTSEQFKLHHAPGAVRHPTTTEAAAGMQSQRKSLLELLQADAQYKQFRENPAQRNATLELPGLDVKTLVTLTTISPQNQRQDLIPIALEERTVADLMMDGTTNVTAIEYYEETTFTNAGAPVAEGGTAPESVEGFTLRTETVRDIENSIPATRQSLDDVAFLESQLRGRISFGVKRAEENQLLNGNGTPPQITGLLNRSGIQTQALGADPQPDAIYKAMQKIRGSAGSGFAEPTAVVINPNNWTPIRLLRSAADLYIWGSPADPQALERIWGKEIRQTTAITAGTALVGAFRPWAEVIRRQGITVELSSEHSTFFVERKVMILAYERLALAVYRPSAFATVTGLP
jgi:HK97 family phage major capsid protein